MATEPHLPVKRVIDREAIRLKATIRIKIAAHGRMNDDLVAFALKDRITLVLGPLTAATLVIARL